MWFKDKGLSCLTKTTLKIYRTLSLWNIRIKLLNFNKLNTASHLQELHAINRVYSKTIRLVSQGKLSTYFIRLTDKILKAIIILTDIKNGFF